MIGETKLRFMTHLLRRKVSACVTLHLQVTSGLSNVWPNKKAASNNFWLKMLILEGICKWSAATNNNSELFNWNLSWPND